MGEPIKNTSNSAVTTNKFTAENCYDNQYNHQGYPNKAIFTAIDNVILQPQRRDPLEKTLDSIRKNNRLLGEMMEFRNLLNKFSSSSQVQNVIPVQSNPDLLRFGGGEAMQNVFSLHSTNNSRRIFGFRIYNTCHLCLEGLVGPVLYPDIKLTTDEMVHHCKPERIATIGCMLDNERHSFEYIRLKDNAFQRLREFVAASHFNHLIPIPLSNPPEGVLKLTNPESRNSILTFWYSQEAHVELNLDSEEQNNNWNDNNICHHWAVRALEQGPIELRDNEVLQFLEMTGKATFAFFKIKRKCSVNFFFMLLSNNTHSEALFLHQNSCTLPVNGVT
jgi:hypothetical protein